MQTPVEHLGDMSPESFHSHVSFSTTHLSLSFFVLMRFADLSLTHES